MPPVSFAPKLRRCACSVLGFLSSYLLCLNLAVRVTHLLRCRSGYCLRHIHTHFRILLGNENFLMAVGTKTAAHSASATFTSCHTPIVISLYAAPDSVRGRAERAI